MPVLWSRVIAEMGEVGGAYLFFPLRSTLIRCGDYLDMESKKERSNKDASWITAFCNWEEALDADTGNPGGRLGFGE